MKAAGVRYAIGRESRAKYGESLAGRQDCAQASTSFKRPSLPLAPMGSSFPIYSRWKRLASLVKAMGKFSRTPFASA